MDGDTISVNYVPAPDISLPEDTVICGLENTYTIDVTTPGAAYLWQDGSTEPTFTITDDGLYYVTVTVGGCNDKDSVLVNYSVQPVVDLGPDASLVSACPVTTAPDLCNSQVLPRLVDLKTVSVMVVQYIVLSIR